MKTKDEIMTILQDMAKELNIVRAGKLAEVRIANQSAKLLQDYPGFIKNQNNVLNLLLEFISHKQANSKTLSSKIEKLKSDIDLLREEENFDTILIIQNIFSIMNIA